MSVQATGHPVSWQAIPQKAFSKTAEPLLAKSYPSSEESAVIKREIDACVAGGPAENCIDMVLRGFSLIDEVELGRLLDTTEQLWPVDLNVVAGERRAIPGATSADIKRLDDVARTSGVVFGFNNLKSRRRQLASSIAAWRGGEDSLPETGSIDDWITALGADHPLVGQLQALRIAASLDRAWGGIPFADDVKWAVEAHRRSGGLAATNLAAVRLRLGDFTAAEALAIDGHLALEKKLGEHDPRTVAAAKLVADAYIEGTKFDLATAYLARVASARAGDKATPTRERLELLLAQSQVKQGAEGLKSLQEAIALIDTKGASAGHKRLQARVLTEAAIKSLALNDFGNANSYARRAFKLDFGNNVAATIQAMSGLMLPNLSVADKSGENHPEFLLSQGWNNSLPTEHPERILNALVWTMYYWSWNARYAPYYARAGADGAAQRLGRRQPDDSSAQEIGQLRTVFELQVQSNWKASTFPN